LERSQCAFHIWKGHSAHSILGTVTVRIRSPNAGPTAIVRGSTALARTPTAINLTTQLGTRGHPASRWGGRVSPSRAVERRRRRHAGGMLEIRPVAGPAAGGRQRRQPRQTTTSVSSALTVAPPDVIMGVGLQDHPSAPPRDQRWLRRTRSALSTRRRAKPKPGPSPALFPPSAQQRPS
jgi:hypothetical protein